MMQGNKVALVHLFVIVTFTMTSLFLVTSAFLTMKSAKISENQRKSGHVKQDKNCATYRRNMVYPLNESCYDVLSNK